jgi:hypothetical protein
MKVKKKWDHRVLIGLVQESMQFMSTGSIVLYPCPAQNGGKISFLRRTTATIDSQAKRQPTLREHFWFFSWLVLPLTGARNPPFLIKTRIFAKQKML